MGRFPLGEGRNRIEAELPESVRDGEYLYAGLEANGRFVLYPGDSPRTRVHAAMKIGKTWLMK